MPIMPVVSGLRPRKPPPPMTVMAHGRVELAGKRRRTPRGARLRTTPPPQIRRGFLDWAIISTSVSMSQSLRSASGILRSLA